MARSLGLPVVVALLVVSACSTPATPTVPPISNRPTPLPTTAASPMPVPGGCSGTQVYAGPGPDADLGLASNPWAAAAPASSGLVAYFWHAPPDVVVANVPNGGDKILWVAHGLAAATLVIDAHPAGSNAPIVHVVASAASSPLDNYPSSVPIPTPGCWQFDLTFGSVKASLAIDVGTTDTSAPSPVPVATPGATAPSEQPSAARYPDGIPMSIGLRPVLRGADALAAAAAVADSRPFYVGGWVTWWPGVRSCSFLANDGEWLRDCPKPDFADRAGAIDQKLDAAITLRFALAGLRTGPVVAEVEVHDARAVGCGTARATCDRMMVVQRIVWSGDDRTAPHPLTETSIQRVIDTIDPGANLARLVPPAPINACGDQLTSADTYQPTRIPDSGPIVTLAELEPSVDARARARPEAEGLAGAVATSSVVCTSYWTSPTGSGSAQWRWLVVANVAVLVRTDVGLSSRDRTYLSRLASALEAAAAGS